MAETEDEKLLSGFLMCTLDLDLATIVYYCTLGTVRGQGSGCSGQANPGCTHTDMKCGGLRERKDTFAFRAAMKGGGARYARR